MTRTWWLYRKNAQVQTGLAIRGRGPERRPYLLHFEFAEVPDTLPEMEDYAQPGRYSGGAGRSATHAADPFRGTMITGRLVTIAFATIQALCLLRQ